ncbi:MAG: DUF3179 domain-containing protein [Deltaproteobacteria bacterium]|nr:DUF3179 domain-containing protein [Deltaproteobacteria bacterium]
MYDRRIAGKELTFGVSGKLHANSLIMYDHQTDSLWSHLVGSAVTGSLKGEKIKPIESMFTRWETWKRLYPGSKVLTSGRTSFFGSLRDPYESYYRSSDTGIIPTRLSDNRIYPKEFVLGLVIHDKAKAYPFSVLSRQPVVNDVFEAVPLLVTFEKESATGMTFTRRVKGQILSFKRVQLTEQRGFFLVDDVTGSVWNGLTGRAIRGRLKGQKLEHLPMASAFWFGWVDHYPKTEIFRAKK